MHALVCGITAVLHLLVRVPESSCQQKLIFLALSFPFPSLGRQIISFGSTGGLSGCKAALNNSEGPTAVISKRKEGDLEGKDV